MAPDSLPKCRVCDKPAANKCGGCASTNQPHSYCGRECQVQDWPRHKNVCSDLQMEARLRCVADFLQAAFFRFRENTWDLPIRKLELSDDKLIMHLGLKGPDDYFMKFPNSLVENEAGKRQVLSIWMCRDALAWMHEIAANLLSKLKVEVHEANFDPYRLPRSISIQLHDGIDPASRKVSHDVLRITSTKTGTQWAIDLTNEQHNFQTCLWRWSDLVRLHVKEVTGLFPFGTYRELNRRLGMNGGFDNLDYGFFGEVVAHMDTSIKQWELEKNISLNDIPFMGDDRVNATSVSLNHLIEHSVRNFIDNSDLLGRFYTAQKYEGNHIVELIHKRKQVQSDFLSRCNMLHRGT